MTHTVEHACPACSSTLLELQVLQSIEVEFNHHEGHQVLDGPTGDLEWGDETRATCLKCGHVGPLASMKGRDQ